MPRGCRRDPLWAHGRMRGCGYRMTMPREAILDVLSSTSEHLSAEEIYLKVHKRYPAVGISTVYRNLEILVDMGLVFKFDFGDKRARYELMGDDSHKEHHHHLVCKRCNRIIDYTDFIEDEVELLKKTEKGLSKKYDFLIENHILQFYGICDKCKGKK